MPDEKLTQEQKAAMLATFEATVRNLAGIGLSEDAAEIAQRAADCEKAGGPCTCGMHGTAWI